MEKNKTFYQIISDYIIEVPIIQREYAQGRKTEKIVSIRTRFVNDLIQAIVNKEEIHLGFIYGKIEGKENLKRKIANKEAVTSILEAVKFYANNLEFKISANIEEFEGDIDTYNYLKFIPLDGQQRLTTLYLLNWYLFFKGAKCNDTKWLKHFKYANRKSSLAFCKELVEESNINSLRIKKNTYPEINIKKLISNSSFFLKKWSKDSTVNGMLEMLLAIEKALNFDFDFKAVILEDLPFVFDFMDLESLNQTDELYVKMNSRGKQLSDYEHFKSWLQEYHKDQEDKEWLSSFWKKLDTDWLNYFWRNIDVDFNALDDFYYNYIKNLALIYCLANNKDIPFDVLKESYSLIRNTEGYDNNKITYIPLDKYFIKWRIIETDEVKEHFLFNLDALKFIAKAFESLLYLEQEVSIVDIDFVVCKPFIDSKPTDLFIKANVFTPTLWHSVFYYSFILFYNDQDKEEFSLTALQEWLRICRNLIYNTYIQSPENYYSALKQINELAKYKFNIISAMLDGKVENTFFDNGQYSEELVKAQLFELDGWKEHILKLENHFYLYGQINFVLDFSRNAEGEYSLSDFIRYSSAISKLYSDVIRVNENRVLERFLLCEGDYLPYYKSDNIFCNGSLGGLRTKNENWRLFFKGEKKDILKKAIDKLEGEEVTLDLVENYINNYILLNDFDKSNWKYLFLNYPEAINYCKESAIRIESDNDVRLLKGFPIYAFHSELRSYCLFLDHKEKNATNANRIAPVKFYPFTRFWYFEDKNTEGHPGVYLEGISYKNEEYKLEVRYSKSNNTYELCFFHKVEIENRKADINLESLHFAFDPNYKHYYKEVHFNDVEEELENICLRLKIILQS